jgi:hypothetical protein
VSDTHACPSCGAPLEVKYRFSRVVVCAYCNQTSTITPSGGLDPATKVPALVAAPSRLAVGRTGWLDGEPCRILGRLRYGYAGGYWDEWFLIVGADERRVWLQEDDGELTAFEEAVATTPPPPFEDCAIGSTIRVNDRALFVSERTRAMIIGGEGELFFNVVPGADVDCVDALAGGETWSIEYQPDETTIARGRPLTPEALVLEP